MPPTARGERLDLVLIQLDPALSRSQAGTLIRGGHVQVLDADGRSVERLKTGLSLRGTETVIVERPERAEPSAAPEDIPLDIRYEDDDLLVVNKPAGLVVHPAPGHAGGTLVNALVGYCSRLSSLGGPVRPGIVHRLDKDTSGLLLVAKHDRSHRVLSEHLSARRIRREYGALAWGHPNPPDGHVDAPIGRHFRGGKKMAVGGRSGRNAVTHYRTVESYSYTSWLLVRLETGRTHQIRVHLAHIGHPVVGDPDYGGRTAMRGIDPTYRQAARELLEVLPHQALHAGCISFPHPTTGETITVSTELPEVIEKARACAAERGSGAHVVRA